MELRLQTTCTIYVNENEEKICAYPCSLNFCTPEIHHYIWCPVWSCFPKTTTAIPTSTIQPSPNDPECSSAFCISSLTLNILFVLGTIAIGSFFLKKRFRRTQAQPGSFGFENPQFNNRFDERPIFRPRSRFPLVSESMPLLHVPSRTLESREPDYLGPVPNPILHSSHSSTVSIPLSPINELHFDEHNFWITYDLSALFYDSLSTTLKLSEFILVMFSSYYLPGCFRVKWLLKRFLVNTFPRFSIAFSNLEVLYQDGIFKIRSIGKINDFNLAFAFLNH